MTNATLLTLGALGIALALPGPPAQAASPAHSQLVGLWRGVLASPGGELPFGLRIERQGDGLAAVAINGEEQAAFDVVRVEGAAVTLRFDVYDSELRATLSDDGQGLEGQWWKAGRARLRFSARRGDPRRFLPGARSAPGGGASLGGPWAVVFQWSSGAQPARGEFTQEGERVRGTFLTPVGDHRYLEGDFREGVLRLSAFDGAHAFLYEARKKDDATLVGTLWAGDAAATPWTAHLVPAGGADGLPDAFSLAGLTNSEGRLAFTFPDLDGHPVSLADARFRGRVVVVNIFGTWCPNCNDEAPLLRQWAKAYRARGFEVIGLAYEQTGEAETDGRSVRTFASHHALDYPLLLAGISDRASAAKTLPDFTGLFAFPNTIFVGRDGRVRKIHSGYEGPATGARHPKLVAELTALVESLLAEPAPASVASAN